MRDSGSTFDLPAAPIAHSASRAFPVYEAALWFALRLEHQGGVLDSRTDALLDSDSDLIGAFDRRGLMRVGPLFEMHCARPEPLAY